MIPNGWELSTLGDIASVNRGKFTQRPRNDPRYYGGSAPFIQTGDVSKANGGVTSKYSQTLSELGVRVSREFPAGTIAITIAANIADTAILGTSMYFPDSVVGAVVQEPHSARFVEMCIRRAKPGLAARAPQSAQKNINLQDLRPLRLVLPPAPEQRRIAEILDTLDETIRKTEQVIKQLQQMKQGLLHDLLTRGINEHGELRDPQRHPEQFKDSPLGRIPKEWEVAALNDTIEPSRPIVYGILMPGQGHPGGVPVVKVKNIFGGEVQTEGLLLTSPALDYEYRRSRLRPGDLLFTIRGTVGRMAFVPEILNGANITQDTARLSIVRADPNFVRYFFSARVPQLFIETHTIGQAVKGINLGELRRLPIALPNIAEQRRIANMLLGADKRLTCESHDVAKLRTLKQGLMDDLLTGRVRVNVKAATI